MRTLIVAALAGLLLLGCGDESVALDNYPTFQFKLDGTPKPETPIPEGQQRFGSILSSPVEAVPTPTPKPEDSEPSFTVSTDGYQLVKVSVKGFHMGPLADRILVQEKPSHEPPSTGLLTILVDVEIEYMAGSRPLTPRTEDFMILDIGGDELDLRPYFYVPPSISLVGKTAPNVGTFVRGYVGATVPDRGEASKWPNVLFMYIPNDAGKGGGFTLNCLVTDLAERPDIVDLCFQ